jgi:23S rRNA pseudouridine1911/1915/1917 synthase
MQTKILYEDKDLFVIHKPAGIAVQSARVGQMDVENELKNYLARKGEEPFIGLVHRLDQPVEGVLVVAKNKKAAAELNKQLVDGILNKTYEAVVYKEEEIEDGSFIDYMIKDGQLAKIVPSATEGAKIAKFQYTIIRKKDDLSLVKVEIETGRFHQIRCQMAHHDMPLLGDTKYGTDTSINISRNCGIRNVALCANEITFIHPTSQKEMHFAVQPMNSAFAKL